MHRIRENRIIDQLLPVTHGNLEVRCGHPVTQHQLCRGLKGRVLRERVEQSSNGEVLGSRDGFGRIQIGSDLLQDPFSNELRCRFIDHVLVVQQWHDDRDPIEQHRSIPGTGRHSDQRQMGSRVIRLDIETIFKFRADP